MMTMVIISGEHGDDDCSDENHLARLSQVQVQAGDEGHEDD